MAWSGPGRRDGNPKCCSRSARLDCSTYQDVGSADFAVGHGGTLRDHHPGRCGARLTGGSTDEHIGCRKRTKVGSGLCPVARDNC